MKQITCKLPYWQAAFLLRTFAAAIKKHEQGGSFDEEAAALSAIWRLLAIQIRTTDDLDSVVDIRCSEPFWKLILDFVSEQIGDGPGAKVSAAILDDLNEQIVEGSKETQPPSTTD